MTRPGRPKGWTYDDWELACEICGVLFTGDGTIGAIELHFDISDGHDPDDIRLVTVYVGPGDEPVMSRAQRRARERRRVAVKRKIADRKPKRGK